MKTPIQITVAGVLLLLSGCFFSRAGGVERKVYDLGSAEVRCSIPVCIDGIRNSSGADRRFFYRTKDNRIEFDSGNFWLLEPEQAMKKLLRGSFGSCTADGIRIEGVIDDFGFDLEKKEAVLTVNFTLSKNGKTAGVKCSERSSFDGRSAASAARAMNKCASKMAEKLAKEIEKFSGSKGEKK